MSGRLRRSCRLERLTTTRIGGSPAGLPGAVLGAGLLQHPLAQRHDQAVLLGQRDELRGEQQAQLRMAPAHQRLGADRRAGPGIHDRLVVELELLPLERAAQGVLQREPLQSLAFIAREYAW